MFLSDLDDLLDVTNNIVFEDEPSIFTEYYAIELVETALQLMDDYIYHNPHIISEQDFQDILLEEIKDLFYIQLESYIENEQFVSIEDAEDDMNDLLEDAFQIFITIFHPDKSFDSKDTDFEYKYNEEEMDAIEKKIQSLRDIPQPVQRTPEWYKFRWNLITASNAWKAFESQSAINQLIYEKCQPLKTFDESGVEEEVKMVNTNSPLHWGQKYEPLTVMVYEHDYKTKVADFGCIQHSSYKFIGASPDGIIINKESDRYGRMLEIKNVVSREITGIPKKEYWTQMQLQMEVCDLDECDFLETKFIEYPDETAFLNDVQINENGDRELTLSSDNKAKGVILYFHTKDGKPFYKYKPLEITKESDIREWEETELEKYEAHPHNYIFIKFIYWKLEKLSCVLVLRNRDWFNSNIGQLEKVWKTIEEERISGYEHRAPNRKLKKAPLKGFVEKEQGCLLKIIKLAT